MESSRSGQRFATTRWSLVARAGATSPERDRALNELCAAYWAPIYSFLRRSHDADASLDLTQGFFERLLERRIVARFDPARGRFRSFLLKALRQHLVDEKDHAAVKKRGGGARLVSLDADGAEEECAPYLADGLTPERAFDRAWTLTLMHRAMERLGAEQTGPVRAARFSALRPLLAGASDAGHGEIAEQLGISREAVKKAMQRLRERYAVLLRLEVADTLPEHEDVDAELRELRRALDP